MVGKGSKWIAYVSSEDEIVDDAHDATHGVGQLVMVVARTGEVDGPAIAQQATGEELVVDVQRGCAQVVVVCHLGGVVGLAIITPASRDDGWVGGWRLVCVGNSSSRRGRRQSVQWRTHGTADADQQQDVGICTDICTVASWAAASRTEEKGNGWAGACVCWSERVVVTRRCLVLVAAGGLPRQRTRRLRPRRAGIHMHEFSISIFLQDLHPMVMFYRTTACSQSRQALCVGIDMIQNTRPRP